MVEEQILVKQAMLLRWGESNAGVQWKRCGSGTLQLLRSQASGMVRLLMTVGDNASVQADHLLCDGMKLERTYGCQRSWIYRAPKNAVASAGRHPPAVSVLPSPSPPTAAAATAAAAAAAADQATAVVAASSREQANSNRSLPTELPSLGTEALAVRFVAKEEADEFKMAFEAARDANISILRRQVMEAAMREVALREAEAAREAAKEAALQASEAAVAAAAVAAGGGFTPMGKPRPVSQQASSPPARPGKVTIFT
jgi:hypothetical protein